MLHDIQDHSYCGPAVLQALTGQRLKPIRELVNEIRGRRPSVGIIGMFNIELEKALKQLGYKSTYIECGQSPTYKPTTLEKLVPRLPKNKIVIVNVTKHFVITDGDLIADNRIRFGCPPDEHPSRRQHVRAIFIIHGKAEAANAI